MLFFLSLAKTATPKGGHKREKRELSREDRGLAFAFLTCLGNPVLPVEF